MPAGTAFAPGSGDFTVDGWIYPISSTTHTVWAQTVAGTNYFLVDMNVPSGFAQITMTSSGGGTPITSAATLRANTWNYFCASRANGNVTVWCNASNGTTTLNTTALTNTSYVPTIGQYSHVSGTNPVIGYLSDIRYTPGIAYLGNVIPTTPAIPYPNTRALLNFTNTGIIDYTGKNNLETRGSTQTLPTQRKNGVSSIFFNGSTDYLQGPALGSASLSGLSYILPGDFTFEAWIYPSANTNNYIAAVGSETTSRYVIVVLNGVLTTNMFGNASISFAGNNIITGAWQHIAVCRSGSTIRGFVNGFLQSNAETNSATLGNGPIRIGSDSSGTSLWSGYMSDVRLTNSIARYITNFGPPASLTGENE